MRCYFCGSQHFGHIFFSGHISKLYLWPTATFQGAPIQYPNMAHGHGGTPLSLDGLFHGKTEKRLKIDDNWG